MATGDPAVLGMRYQPETEVTLLYHNLSDEERSVDGGKEVAEADVYEVFADAAYDSPEPGTDVPEINGFGHRWFNGQPRHAYLPEHVSEAGGRSLRSRFRGVRAGYGMTMVPISGRGVVVGWT